MLHTANPSKILVFLPQAAGAMIITKLSECGYVSVAVSTVSDAFDALRSDEFIFAITTRPDIDIVRNIRALPVINLEVFFHASISGEGAPVNSKRFDSKAFLDRVAFLTRTSVDTRTNVETGRATGTSSQFREKGDVRWWRVAANALHLARNRKGAIDVPT